jgi:hypothetical protein
VRSLAMRDMGSSRDLMSLPVTKIWGKSPTKP